MPAVIYGGESALPLTLEEQELLMVLGGGKSETPILRLQIQGERKQRQVILKEVQYDPIRGQPLHVDLYEVSMDREIRVSIPITLTGEAPGVKRDGGILHQNLRELEIECLPGLIPGETVVNLSSLEMGDVIHVRDMKLGEGIRIITDPEEPVVSVARPEVEEVAAPEEVPAEEEEAVAAAEEAEAPKPPAEKEAKE